MSLMMKGRDCYYDELKISIVIYEIDSEGRIRKKLSLWFLQCILFDRWLLLTRKILHQRFLVVKLKSSLQMLYGRHYDQVNRYRPWVSQVTTVSSICRNHNSILSSFRTYHGGGKKSKPMVATSGEETATRSEHTSLTVVLSGVRVSRS